ncbi:hypothetical protein KL86PLE_40533 [uncultured Pleomorphomonas sp.]|uniref:Uncharacterized protein n=1 Tax=uncultured Pleomorphomonas sp. TaxID=442121 RepID=A0A212LGV0_9HYPH|nr:hypothetical protein KL86PLE_40533 [uncultured Pleomorphomonas sp.]
MEEIEVMFTLGLESYALLRRAKRPVR